MHQGCASELALCGPCEEQAVQVVQRPLLVSEAVLITPQRDGEHLKTFAHHSAKHAAASDAGDLETPDLTGHQDKAVQHGLRGRRPEVVQVGHGGKEELYPRQHDQTAGRQGRPQLLRDVHDKLPAATRTDEHHRRQLPGRLQPCQEGVKQGLEERIKGR